MTKPTSPLLRLGRRALGVAEHGMPRRALAFHAVLAAHIARESSRRLLDRHMSLRATGLRALADAILFETASTSFGPTSMIRGGHGLFPHIFLPNYHGAHFEEAVLRILDPSRGPNILYLSLTGACPCRCEYCFASAGESGSPDIGDERSYRVADAVAKLRIPLVNLSGGEPLVRFDRLLESVRRLSRGCEVRLFTTGFGLTAERLRALRDAGLTGLFVSLDTDQPAVFDRTRRKHGSFDAAVRALELAARADVLTFVNCVVDRKRFPDAESVASFLSFVERIDPRIVVNFLPQLSTGRGAAADSFQSPDECEPIADLILGTARRLGRPITMLFGRVDTFMGCVGAGGRLMNLDIFGNVTVCISRAALGNVLEEPFERIYERFVASCVRLKVGFFCCSVGADGEPILAPDASRTALDRFYAKTRDSDWQRTLDRYGGVLRWLYAG